MTTDGSVPSVSPVVGVAIPVPEPWGSFLQQQRREYGDPRADHTPTHVTLLPPTPLRPAQIRPFREHLALVARSQPSFEVVLRGTGTFRPVSEVVYVQLARGVSSCERLESAVRSGPVERALAFPYHPHVTVVHDGPGHVLDRAFEDLAAFTCRFEVESFRLYLHSGDEVWSQVEDYRLTPRTG